MAPLAPSISLTGGKEFFGYYDMILYILENLMFGIVMANQRKQVIIPGDCCSDHLPLLHSDDIIRM